MDSAKAEKIERQITWEQQRDHYPENFPALPEIPGGRYTSQAFYDLEMEHIWRKSWLVACRADEIEEVGQHKLFSRFGVNLIIVGGKDHVIRAFHNTCRHRGAPIIASDGKRNVLTCRYHSWSYGLDGQLLVVPEEQDFGDLDKCSRGLLPVRCEQWDGWVFINLDENAKPLLEEYAPLLPDLDCLDMKSLRLKGRLTYTINCNWKAAVDAFLEAYHVKSIHQNSVARLLDGKATDIGLFNGGHTRMSMAKLFNREGGTWGTDAAAYDIPSVPKVFRENNMAYGMFPNYVAPFDSAGFPFVTFWPISRDQCECELMFVGAGDPNENCENSEYWKTFAANYDIIQKEDFQFLAGIQQSLDSGAFTGMKLSYQERRIYWMHEEYDRRIGIDRIPEELRVEQVLSPFVEG
jgi:phenylpropionate dioxygenase-like ring-hydroxylating dioxygenase large terminal subunit